LNNRACSPSLSLSDFNYSFGIAQITMPSIIVAGVVGVGANILAVVAQR
jgi:hypothetical protein